MKGTVTAAERTRIKHVDYNAKCDELGIPNMRIRVKLEKSRFIQAAFDDMLRWGQLLEVDGIEYDLRIARITNDRLVFKMLIESRQNLKWYRWSPCLEVLYTKRKAIRGDSYFPGTDKLAYKAHTPVGEALRGPFDAKVEERAGSTTLGQVIHKVEKVLTKMSEAGGSEYGCQGRNRWELPDEDEPEIQKMNLLMLNFSDTTYLRKES